MNRGPSFPLVRGVVALFLLTLVSEVCLAQGQTKPVGTPTGVAGMCEANEGVSNTRSFAWHVWQSETSPAFDKIAVERGRLAIREETESEAAKKGITDRALIEKEFEATLKKRSADWGGYSHIFEADWSVVCQGDYILAEGQLEYQNGAVLGYRQHYGKDWGAIENLASFPGKSGVVGNATEVWASVDAIRAESPIRASLELRPEDFVALCGRNPFSLYGVRWNVKNSGRGEVTLTADVRSTRHGMMSSSVRVNTLRGTVSEVILGNDRYKYVYACKDFKKIGDAWYATYFSTVEDVVGVRRRERTFRLKSVTPAASTRMTVKSKRNIVDFRLLGVDIGTAELVQAFTRRDPRIVQYAWPGEMPTVEELGRKQARRQTTEQGAARLSILQGFACLSIATFLLCVNRLRQSRSRGGAGDPEAQQGSQ